jgi:hypothetical protein
MRNDVSRQKGKSFVNFGWLYKFNHFENGSIEKFNVRFVARGFPHKEGVDYDETFSPVSIYNSIRAVIFMIQL